MQRFGATLRQYRKQRRLTQRALAAKTGLSAAYISDIELGKYNVSMLTLLRLAQALDVPSSWLLARLNPNDPLPPPEAQDAETSSTPFLTPEDQSALLSLLGSTLRQSRQRQRLTQQTLATKTDLDNSYISEIELGARNVTILNLIRLANALDLSVNHLLAILDTSQRSSSPLPE